MHFGCVTSTAVLDAGQCCCCGARGLCTAPMTSESAQVCLWETKNQVIKVTKSPGRNVWWDLHCWMASKLTLMTKWKTTIYAIFAVFSIWLFFPSPSFYFELLPKVRVAIRNINIFKHKVEILRWGSQFLIKTFQEGQDWTIPSSSKWDPLAGTNLRTEGTWNFKAT